MAAETSESIGMFRDRGREVGGGGWWCGFRKQGKLMY